MRQLALAMALMVLSGCRAMASSVAPPPERQVRPEQEADLVLTPRRPSREEVAQESLLFELGNRR